MQVIFILSPGDSVVVLRTIYQIATWLKENRGMEIIVYLPQIKNFKLLPQDIIDLRWLKDDLKAIEIPEADIILSTSAEILFRLSKLNRGELVFIARSRDEGQGLPPKVRIVDFDRLKPAIPEMVFTYPGGSKRDKVVIAGESLSLPSINLILKSIEKAGTSIFAGEIVILDFQGELEPETSLNFTIKKTDEIDLLKLLADSFYFFWIGQKSFPLLALWAMAAGVIVINIELGGWQRSFPLEFYEINPLELALCMIKVYKLGQQRRQLKGELKKMANNYAVEMVGGDWAKFLEERLHLPPQERKTAEQLPANASEESVIDLIIVNYNTLPHLKSCLTSIQKFTRQPHQVMVIDNNSTDGSKEFLQELNGVKVIANEQNLGYARACNQGILHGNSKYLALLNSDIEVKEGWLEPLLTVLAEEDVAVVGPKMINKEGYIVGAGVDQINDSYWPRGWMEKEEPGVFDQQEDLISVGGACYLLKRDLLPVLGLFDEEYFFYFEELDYSLRAREKGYRVVYCPQSVVYHHHEGTLDLENFLERLKRNRYFIESKKRFQRKWNCVLAGGKKRREPPTIVVAGLIPWDFRQQRPQHLLRNMAKQGYRILYLNPVCGDFAAQEVEKGIYVYSPPGYGTIFYNILQGNDRRLGRDINQQIKELGFAESILMLHAPYWVPLLKFWEYSLLVFDCIDKYTEFADLAPYQNILTGFEEKLLNLSDLVLTPSQRLYQEKKSSNQNTYLLPNGVDITHFHYQYKPALRPADLPSAPRIIGYFGAIAGWFDVELVSKVAKQMPDTELVLIGEVSTDISKLSRVTNISLLGEKPYSTLPDYLAYFDLAIIPFRKNALTRLTDPVKIYEYLAGGIPVLSVDLPELHKFKDVVELAANDDEFIGKAEEMLVEGRGGAEKRYNAVKEETWLNRAVRLKELLHLAYYDLFLADNGRKERVSAVEGESKVREENEEVTEDMVIKVQENTEGWVSRLKRWLKAGGDE